MRIKPIKKEGCDLLVKPSDEARFHVDEVVRNNPSSTENVFFDIPSVGFGTQRSSGTWILLMLLAEDKSYREDILADIMRRLNISPERIRKVMDDKACKKCGMSLLLHEDNNGQCF